MQQIIKNCLVKMLAMWLAHFSQTRELVIYGPVSKVHIWLHNQNSSLRINFFCQYLLLSQASCQ